MFDVIPRNYETWAVCGGRDFADWTMFDAAMSDLIRLKGVPDKIIHGACGATFKKGRRYKGADGMADEWAKRFAIDVAPFPADWDTHGKAAGPIRNQEMIDLGKPHFVVAFPGGSGTADMVRKARAAKIDVAEIKQTGAD